MITDGTADQHCSLPAEGETGDDVVVMRELGQQVTIGDVPDQDPPVARPRGDESAVRGETDDEHSGLVAGHQPHAVARHTVPET